MRVWCATVQDPAEGLMLIWATSQRAARSEAIAYVRRGDAEGRHLVTVESQEIPTDRKGLVDWLNAHFETDNG